MFRAAIMDGLVGCARSFSLRFFGATLVESKISQEVSRGIFSRVVMERQLMEVISFFPPFREVAGHFAVVPDEHQLMARPGDGDIQAIRIPDKATPPGEGEGNKNHIGFAPLAAVDGQVFNRGRDGDPVFVGQFMKDIAYEVSLGLIKANHG